jgi:SAM-dependent methyltransferase
MIDLVEFWEQKHVEQDGCWLTGAGPGVYATMGLGDLLQTKRLNVLEIGIGTGTQIRALAERHSVIAVDICPSALLKVNDCAKTVLTCDMPSIESQTIDIAICHLVFQHCAKNMFEFIVEQTIRTLKIGGEFVFQTAGLPNIESVLKGEIPCTFKWENKGIIPDFYAREIGKTHFFRDIEDVMATVNRFGRVISVSNPIVYPDHCNITWNYVRCGR